MTQPGPVQRWVLAARPRTLPAALVPVAAGATVVIHHGTGHAPRLVNTVLAALVALLLQIGTNFANDYSDGVKGTDEVRVGPFRLTASRLVPASRVKLAAFACFGVAALAGLVLSSRSSWWLVLLGAASILAGWFYTGGPKPYGYYGFGELFVLVFFGFVATVGSAFVQGLGVPMVTWLEALAAGMAAVVLLEANNIRDIDGDRVSGKKTLAARLGRERAGLLYVTTTVITVLALALSALGHRWWFIVLLPLGVVARSYRRPVAMARSTSKGRELLPILPASAASQLLVGAGLVILNFVR